MCGTPVFGCTVMFGCLLCCIVCWSVPAWSIDGSGCTVLLVRALAWITYWLVSGIVCRSMLAVRSFIRPGGCFDFWLWGSEASSSNSGSNFCFGYLLVGRLPSYFTAALSTLLYLIPSVSCAALSFCFCFFRLLAVATSLLRAFCCSGACPTLFRPDYYP